MGGEAKRAKSLRIGYFAQHQVDALNLNETPLDHLRRLRPSLAPGALRARLAQGGLGAELVEMKVQNLSGGQKARLSLLLATLDEPQLLVLDEPTNHLDIESRDALIRALASYEGAVILVSHDPHLVNAVADRLWLVKAGHVTPYEGDVETYRQSTLADRKLTGRDPSKSKPKKERQAKSLARLQAATQLAEDRVQKLEAMLAKLDQALSDPSLYESENLAKLGVYQAKRGELTEALVKAETQWEAAVQAEEALA